MSVKASKEDVSSFQSYTIRTLNQKQSTISDIESYKLVNINEDVLENCLKFLDVMCFPHLFSSGFVSFTDVMCKSPPVSMPNLGCLIRTLGSEKTPSMYSFSYGRKNDGSSLQGFTN